MHDQKVSIIVPFFNAAPHLEECIISIKSQSHQNIEIILVNDGSSDASEEIALRYAEIDSRIIVISQRNGGVSSARNAGLKISSGKYVCFIDSDDCVDERFIERLLTAARNHKANLTLSTKISSTYPPPYYTPGTEAAWTPEYTIEQFLYGRVTIGCWNKLYELDLINRRKIEFNEDQFMGEGLLFIVKYAQASERIVAIDCPLYYYRRDNSESATTKISVKKYENALKSIDLIRQSIVQPSQRVAKALTFQHWHTTLYLLVAAREENMRIHEIDSAGTHLKTIHKNAFAVLTSHGVNFRRKLLALVAIMSPSLSVTIASSRRKL